MRNFWVILLSLAFLVQERVSFAAGNRFLFVLPSVLSQGYSSIAQAGSSCRRKLQTVPMVQNTSGMAIWQMANYDPNKLFPDSRLIQNLQVEGAARRATLHKLIANSKSVLTYWKIAHAMHEKDLIPLVHGQPVSWLIAHKLLEKLGYRGCQLLRVPEGNEDFPSALDIRSRVSKNKVLAETSGQVIDPQMRDHLLSVTIGLFHLDPWESAVAFAYGGAFSIGNAFSCRGNQSSMGEKKTKEALNSLVRRAFLKAGLSEERIGALFKEIEHLYAEAVQMRRGQIIVIGIPAEELDLYGYHCVPGGYPTDASLSEIARSIQDWKLPVDGAQGRLYLSQELMDPKNGVVWVNLMDHESVDAFCEGSECDDFHQDGLLFQFINPSLPDLALYRMVDVARSEIQGNVEAIERKNCEDYSTLKEKIEKLVQELPAL